MNKQGFLNLLLAATLVLLLGLFLLLHTDTRERNQYLLKGMVTSPAAQDFAANPYFANGQTLQLPPKGTVPQGFPPYHFQGGPVDSLKAGAVLKNPFNETDPDVLERGAVVFNRDCMPCHGVDGRGDGPVSMNTRQGGFPGVANLLSDHAKSLKDGYIYNYISRGGVLMPSYGAQIVRADRWKVVAYVRHMQQTLPEEATTTAQTATVQPVAAAAATGASQATSSDEAEPGDAWATAYALIKKQDCLSCHSVDKKVVGPAYRDVARRYAGKPGIVAVLVKKVKMGGAGNWGQIPMVAHPNISNKELTIIIKGILSLAGGHAMATHSLKEVTAMIHAGIPVRCPAVGVGVGPQFLALDGRGAAVDQAQVIQVSSREVQP